MPIITFILGAAIGSFINALATRFVNGQSIILPGSCCEFCAKPILPKDLVPIVSFFILRGKCRFCRKKISWQHPIIEAVVGLLFFIAYSRVNDISWELVALWLGIFVLITLFITDLRAMILPDIITIPAIAIFLIIDLFVLKVNFAALLISVLIGGGFFLLQYLISRGRWIGSGDIRFGVLMAVILVDWQKVLLAIMASYIIGSVISIALIALRRKTLKSEVPLGVFLVIGTILAMLL